MPGRRGILLLFLTLLHSEGILAQSPGSHSIVHSSISAFKRGHVVFQAGGYWSSQGKAQHIDIDGLIGDEFTLNKRDDSNGLVGLGYFIDGQNLGQTQLSYGVNFFYLPRTSVTDQIINNLQTGHAYANAALCSVRI